MATDYEYLKLVHKVKDPYRGMGQGDETVVLESHDNAGKRGQIRRISRDGDTVTIECIDGPSKGLRVTTPWTNVRWGREARRAAEAPAKAAEGGKAR